MSSNRVQRITIPITAGVFVPSGDPENWGITTANSKLALWPPQFFFKAVLWWCDFADKLLCVNPLWLKAMCFTSPFVYGPYYLVAIWAIWVGKEWIRVPTLLVAGALLYSLTVILAEQLWGTSNSQYPEMILLAYGAYWLVPFWLFVRFWGPHPFTERIGHSKED